MTMITKDNFQSALKRIDVKGFPETLGLLHSFVMEASMDGTNWNAYENSDVGSMVDEYFKELNKYLSKNKDTHKASEETSTKQIKEKKTPREKKEPAPKQPRRTALQPEPIDTTQNDVDLETGEDVELVERIPDEIKFMRRYLSFNGKRKMKVDFLRFIKALQRAIVEKKVRKASPYAKQINYIQKKLVDQYNSMGNSIPVKIEGKTIDEFKRLISLEKVMPSVRLIKRYINLNGQSQVKEKAKQLIAAIEKAFDKGLVKKNDKLYKTLNKMTASLNNYVKSRSHKTLIIEQAELSGLNGIVSLHNEIPAKNALDLTARARDNTRNHNARIMYISDARNAHFKTIGLTGKWRNLIGNACKPTHLLAYGEGGSGKSSLILTYAAYLNSLGFKILYAAGEEYNTPTFTDLLNRLNITGNCDFVIVKDLNTLRPSDFDFVALDSKDSLGIEVEDFRELKKKYPEQSFLISSQGTKSGDFTGSGQWKNEVDTMIFCEDGVAKTIGEKNRWGGKGEMRIFDDTNYRAAA